MELGPDVFYSMKLITIIQVLLNILFPPRCLICWRLGEDVICRECVLRIKRYPNEKNSVRSFGVYEGILRKAIKKLKFKNKKKLAEPLAFMLVSEVDKYFSDHDIDYMVSVPLSKKRLRTRGFNQVDLMADVVSRELGIPFYSDLLRRRKETKPQFGLKREERFSNIRGAFSVADPKNVEKKAVLLLDDIYTTGATVSECSKVLEAAGAKKVYILTLARAIE